MHGFGPLSEPKPHAKRNRASGGSDAKTCSGIVTVSGSTPGSSGDLGSCLTTTGCPGPACARTSDTRRTCLRVISTVGRAGSCGFGSNIYTRNDASTVLPVPVRGSVNVAWTGGVSKMIFKRDSFHSQTCQQNLGRQVVSAGVLRTRRGRGCLSRIGRFGVSALRTSRSHRVRSNHSGSKWPPTQRL